MLEQFSGVVVLLVVGFIIVFGIRRRLKMTPEERRIARLEYKQRQLEKKLADHKRYGS